MSKTTDRAADAAREEWALDEERERIAVAIEVQIRHLLAGRGDVMTVPRDLMALSLQNLAADVRGGRYV